MTGPTTPIIDDFNRTENPVTGYTALNGSAQANGATLQANAANTVLLRTSPNPLPGADAEVYIKVSTIPSNNNYVGIGLRAKDTGSIATVDDYQLEMTKQTGTDIFRIARTDNAVGTSLTTFNQEFSNGDQGLLRAVGSRLEAEYFNGTSWSALGSTTDSTYPNAGGIPLILTDTTARADDLGFGNIHMLERGAERGAFRGILRGTA